MANWLHYQQSQNDNGVLVAALVSIAWPISVFWLDSRHFVPQLFHLYTLLAYFWAFIVMAPLGAFWSYTISKSFSWPHTKTPAALCFLAALLGVAFVVLMGWYLPRLMNDEQSFLAAHNIRYNLSWQVVLQRYLIWLLLPSICSLWLIVRGVKLAKT